MFYILTFNFDQRVHHARESTNLVHGVTSVDRLKLHFHQPIVLKWCLFDYLFYGNTHFSSVCYVCSL